MKMNLAHVTQDGIAKSVGVAREKHPAYGTDAYGLHLYLPLLRKEEGAQFDELTSRNTGTVRFSVRSALAQLGVDAFHPSALTMKKSANGKIVQVDTLITSLNGEKGECVIDAIRAQTQQHKMPTIARTVFLPDAAHLSPSEVAAARRGGSLIVGPDAIQFPNGSLGLSISPVMYEFRQQAWAKESIARILSGEGRKTLAEMREEYDELPAYMHAGEFLVAGVDVNTTENHVILRRQTVSEGGRKSPVIHGESCLMEAGRTFSGSRQLELWNANGHSQPVSQLRIVADLYRAADVAKPGH